MSPPLDRIIQKANDLLALKERASTEGEAQAAAFALAKLLDKHRISITELEITGNAPSESILVDRENPLIEFEKLASWKRALVTVSCIHYGVVWWRNKSPVGHTRNGKIKFYSRIYLCGRPSDLQMVRYMYAWISSEAGRLSESECAGKGRRHTNSWLSGFVDGIAEQLKNAREEVFQDASADAGLVLRKRLDDSIKALEDAVKPKVATFNLYRGDQAAREAGRRRGEQHHLGQNLDTGAHRALPEGK